MGSPSTTRTTLTPTTSSATRTSGPGPWSSTPARRRTAWPRAWTTRHQAALFFPFLLGEAINLHVASVRRLFRPGLRLRVPEALLLTLHFVGYVALLATTLTWTQALVFVALHKGVQGLYLGCSFAPNHKGMPTLDADQAADPLLRQVLTSRNVRGGPFIDTALGGLNYQIEHHLFPSMPRANLRRAQPVVERFCVSRGIPYAQCSVVASYTCTATPPRRRPQLRPGHSGGCAPSECTRRLPPRPPGALTFVGTSGGHGATREGRRALRCRARSTRYRGPGQHRSGD